MIYAILALGLNILIGYAGQFAFANAALFGIGAYCYGLLVVKLGAPFGLAVLGGAVGALLVGALIAIPALRLQGVYLALVTLSFAQFTHWVLTHWDDVTYGAGGFRVPPFNFTLLGIAPPIVLFSLTWLTTLVAFLCCWNVIHSRYGRAFAAVRDGETAAQSLGINLALYKGLAFGISGLLAGIAGAFHAATLNFVAPESFDLSQMVLQFTMVLLGGLGSLVGSLIGAACLMLMMEITRGARDLQTWGCPRDRERHGRARDLDRTAVAGSRLAADRSGSGLAREHRGVDRRERADERAAAPRPRRLRRPVARHIGRRDLLREHDPHRTKGRKIHPTLGFERGWVIYNGYAEASRVPPSWHGWLHHTVDVAPTEESYMPRDGKSRMFPT